MKKGISLISLFITALVLLILATTVTITGVDALNNAKISKFATEIAQIQNLVDSYKEANFGEYPIGDSAVIDISGLTDLAKAQFADENKISETKVNLYVIDMSLLSKTDLIHGNKKTDTDVYVVSKKTGKVYYAQGFKANGKTYYTLTGELLEIVDYSNNLKAINKDGILFYLTNSNWTNVSIDAIVKVPDNSDYSSINVSTKSGTTTLSNVSLSSSKSGYKIYNVKNIDTNCDIVVNYDKEGVGPSTQSYSITNIDKVNPTLDVEKQEAMVSAQENDKKVYIKVNANDYESGIAFTKYEADEIDEGIANEYFLSNGISVKDNAITVDRYTSVVTIYTQDKAGNGTYQKVNLTAVAADETDYVQNGLVIQYDGINNTGNGHSNTVSVWKNLVSNNYDGVLKNFSLNSGSGWTSNGLKFDGVDDWVSIGELNLPKVTIEAVVKYDAIGSGEMEIVSNFENGGYGLHFYNSKNIFAIYLSDHNSYYRTKSSNNVVVNKNYSLSGSYDNVKAILYENGKKVENAIYDTIGLPQLSTILAVGCNPQGDTSFGGEFLNGEILSVRIYNRALLDEEVKQNYRIDKIRFGVE